jgi:septal ring factor EnvC (AmiA/AmiB activator)
MRRERAELEDRMAELQKSARSIGAELANLERQEAATNKLVAALDTQLEQINSEIALSNAKRASAELELSSRRVALQRRVVDIYKRGSLYEAEVLLSAQTFGALVARYKYLYELARTDQRMVNQVEGLRDQIESQRQLLVQLQDEVERNRLEKSREQQRLAQLEQRRQRSLANVQRNTSQTRERLQQIARDEARVASVISNLETARRRAELAPNARPAAPSSIRTSDLGKLDWPVDGTILYRFGRVVNPNNTTTRWNGMGIAASTGAPVRAVSAGEVVLADQIGTYGQTVIVQHGGGDYSVYGSLQRIDVRQGQQVQKGQVIGAVGAADPDLPPHLHFEIRPKGRAVDPLEWLRSRGENN